MSQDLIKRLEALVDAVSIMKRDDERYQGEIPASTISRVYEAHSAILKAKEAQEHIGHISPFTMTKGEMLIGLQAGRTLTQEEWASPDEIRAVDELVFEGKASATMWEYKSSFQCKRRKIRGIGGRHES